VCSHFGYSNKKATNPENLIWTGSFQEFIDFFEPLIDHREILYKGEKDKFTIYTKLLSNIFIRKEPDKTIENIVEALNIVATTSIKDNEKCKLTWNNTRSEFVKKFKLPTNMTVTNKSLFLYHEVNSLRAISKKFHEMFKIENEKHPGRYITEESLYQAFKA